MCKTNTPQPCTETCQRSMCPAHRQWAHARRPIWRTWVRATAAPRHSTPLRNHQRFRRKLAGRRRRLGRGALPSRPSRPPSRQGPAGVRHPSSERVLLVTRTASHPIAASDRRVCQHVPAVAAGIPALGAAHSPSVMAYRVIRRAPRRSECRPIGSARHRVSLAIRRPGPACVRSAAV